MKILVISEDGFGARHALKFKEEGNDVRFFTRDPQARDIYRGILDSEKSWEPWLSWCDFVVFTQNKLSDIWEICHKVKPCYGGSTAGQKLEKDRVDAHKLMKSLGMKVPESIAVKTTAEAISHLQKHKVNHVLKFTGGNTDSDDVFLGEYSDSRDLFGLCHKMDESGKKWDSIEIEEKIDGVEAGLAGYFDGTRFTPHIELNFQMKRFCAGNKGQGVGFLTGEMGTLIKFVDQNNAFYKRTLGKMVPYLKSIKYRGQIDVGCIVNDQGDFFIEHTPREGIPDYVIQYAVRKIPTSRLFYSVAIGKGFDSVSSDWAIGIVVVSPGFPDPKSSAKRSVGLPIFGYEENKGHCHLFEARKVDHGLEISEGGYGYPLVVTGSGATIEESQQSAYRRLQPNNPSRVYVPKAWYRSDIGDRVINEMDRIKKLGILPEDPKPAKFSDPIFQLLGNYS